MIIVDQFMNENYGIIIENELNIINEGFNNGKYILSESQLASKFKMIIGKIKSFVITAFKKIQDKILFVINKIKDIFKKIFKGKNKEKKIKNEEDKRIKNEEDKKNLKDPKNDILDKQYAAAIKPNSNDNNIIKGYRINTGFSLDEYRNDIKKIVNKWDKCCAEITDILNKLNKSKDENTLNDINNLVKSIEEEYKKDTEKYDNDNFKEIRKIIEDDEASEIKISEIKVLLNKLLNFYKEINNNIYGIKKIIINRLAVLSALEISQAMQVETELCGKGKPLFKAVKLLHDTTMDYYSLTDKYISNIIIEINYVLRNLVELITNK